MISMRALWFTLSLLWLGAEFLLVRRSRGQNHSVLVRERLSEAIVWLACGAGLALAFVFKSLQWLPLSVAYLPRQAAALTLFFAGLGLRFYAIAALGDFFSTQLRVHKQHPIIRHGPYRWLRHPAYSGLLLAFAAIGVAMGDLLVICSLLIPLSFALSTRIALEETLLLDILGNTYADYCRTTKKLIPFIY